jgi:hypothetical protein
MRSLSAHHSPPCCTLPNRGCYSRRVSLMGARIAQFAYNLHSAAEREIKTIVPNAGAPSRGGKIP